LAESDHVDLHDLFDAALHDFDRAQELQDENPVRARQLFLSAAQRFESMAAMGVESGPLEYNLGNCYLQAGNVGRAVLHYRRAERLTPNDPLLRDNLREARSRCLTSIPPSRERRFVQSVFFWHFDTTRSGRLATALTFYGLFWLSLTGRSWVRRRWLSVSASVFGVLTLAVAASLAVSDWTDRNAPPGVVVGMDVPVHHGPGTSYQRRFEQPLQPGTEFKLLERRGSWWNIELPDAQTGWIEATAAELVPQGIS
jgi:hypothetical protein